MCEKLNIPKGAIYEEATSTHFSEWLGKERSLFLGTLCVDEMENGIFIDYLKMRYPHIDETIRVRPYTECLRGNNVTIHENMLRTVRIAKEHGFKIAMLTNNMFLDIEHKEPRLPIDLTHFVEVVESCIEHTMKPNLDFYQICEKRLGVKGEQIVFLDDIQENLDAAQKLGWKTIKVGSNVQEAVDELSKMINVKFD
ncbi:unnamed protein product [Caenorhabditis bovis]|uniref:Uncharacterized protein n=1 Tax=Caenorhabditis bovis TaxID=2654633 RepID=A0A8S1EV54_9PELO|nr:unnamed protein product [Caenorhabditis bovis]